MKTKTFFKVAGIIFLLIASLHLLRAVLGWDILINSVVIPMWVSWVVVVIAGFLAYAGLTKVK